MQAYIRTAVNSEVSFPPMKKERGVRLWRGAEVPASVWFLVELCVDQRRDIEIRTFVTTDISYAYWLEQTMSSVRWSSVTLFMRYKEVTKQPLLYRRLTEAYRSKTTGARVFHLDTGHVISEPGLPTLPGQEATEDLELVYREFGSKAELYSLP